MGKKKGEPASRYSLIIEWSDVDHLYIVSFPEWKQAGCHVNTHGKTYEKAARRGWKTLRFLLAATEEQGGQNLFCLTGITRNGGRKAGVGTLSERKSLIPGPRPVTFLPSAPWSIQVSSTCSPVTSCTPS